MTIAVVIAITLLVFAGLIWTLWWGGSQFMAKAPGYSTHLDRFGQEMSRRAQSAGLPIGGDTTAASLSSRLGTIAGRTGGGLKATLTIIGLTLAFYILGLAEARDIKARIQSSFRPAVGNNILEAIDRIARSFRGYLVAGAIGSLVSAVAVGGISFALGIELALVWGLLAALLNLLPAVGPAVAIIPPTVIALIQFGGVARPLTAFLAIGTAQFIIGNFVDPKIGGKVLKLSPLAILFSVVFWGWLWGGGGALLAVPILAASVITLEEFSQTRWIASLLRSGRTGAAPS